MKTKNKVIAAILCTVLSLPSFPMNNICNAETYQYMGDIDYDGMVTSEDALFILQYVISDVNFSQEQKEIADLDKDKTITSSDALAVLQCVSGLSEPQIYDNNSDISDELSEENIYNAMIAFEDEYPEGTTWTNDNYYVWNGGIFSMGYGCAGFAFMLSDAAFGSLPARQHYDISAVSVGDIVRVNNDSHSVIVLEVNAEGIIVAEGNYGSSVHWGREISWSQLETQFTYVMTRYPE